MMTIMATATNFIRSPKKHYYRLFSLYVTTRQFDPRHMTSKMLGVKDLRTSYFKKPPFACRVLLLATVPANHQIVESET